MRVRISPQAPTKGKMMNDFFIKRSKTFEGVALAMAEQWG